jgi:hypothetical protein
LGSGLSGWAEKRTNVRDPHGLEDVFLEVIVQLEARGPLDQNSRPVDVDPVLPHLAGLVDQRLREIVVVRAGELVEAHWAGPFVEAVVEEGVTEAR